MRVRRHPILNPHLGAIFWSSGTVLHPVGAIEDRTCNAIHSKRGERTRGYALVASRKQTNGPKYASNIITLIQNSRIDSCRASRPRALVRLARIGDIS
jgi:hypothetical protein